MNYTYTCAAPHVKIMSNKKNTTKLLISVSDPLLFYVRIRNWKNNLKPYFDNLLVAISPGPDSVNVPQAEFDKINQFFVDITKDDDSIKLNFLDHSMNDHGVNIRYLTQNYWDNIGDTVLLMEDDDFITDTGILEKYLSRVKNREVDVIGTTRGCTNNSDLLKFCSDVLSEDEVIENMCPHTQPNFTPTHLIFNKGMITPNEVMEAQSHEVGEVLYYRGRKFEYGVFTCMDTFVDASLRIGSRANKIYEHRPYIGGTSGDFYEFSYFFSLTSYPTHWKKPSVEQSNEWVDQQYQYHIGSATCLCRAGCESVDFLNQSLFEESKNFLSRIDVEDHAPYTLLEFYRRLYIYKAMYELVRNDAAFARFVPMYDKNLALAEDFFKNVVKIEDIMKKVNYKFMDIEYYRRLFVKMLGDKPL